MYSHILHEKKRIRYVHSYLPNTTTYLAFGKADEKEGELLHFSFPLSNCWEAPFGICSSQSPSHLQLNSVEVGAFSTSTLGNVPKKFLVFKKNFSDR